MEKIIVTGLEVTACHGLLDFERVIPQPFVIDLVMIGHFAAAKTDCIEDTVDYGAAASLACKVALQNSFFMIERLAGAIADALLLEFPLILKATVTVHKPKAPINDKFSDIKVEIERGRTLE